MKLVDLLPLDREGIDELVSYARRSTEALERIAAALEAPSSPSDAPTDG